MKEALHDAPLYREFARLDGWTDKLPDETIKRSMTNALD